MQKKKLGSILSIVAMFFDVQAINIKKQNPVKTNYLTYHFLQNRESLYYELFTLSIKEIIFEVFVRYCQLQIVFNVLGRIICILVFVFCFVLVSIVCAICLHIFFLLGPNYCHINLICLFGLHK